MATYNQGITGPFSGGVGEAVGSSWKGIKYIRSYAEKISNPQTVRQQDHRQKIAVTMKFLSPLKEFLRIGFKDFAVRMSEFNAAMSWNYHNALKGSYPDNSIDYPKALLSRGTLQSAASPSVASIAEGIVLFMWNDDPEPNPADKTMLAVFNPAKSQAVTSFGSGKRSDGMQAVSVPNSFSGDLVHYYIAFITIDGQTLSNSKYAGTVLVA